VIIHSGTVIGSDGFGYVQHEGRHVKIPQLGGVVIEDDVELGANVAVDRATFGQTVVKRGTKVDNLVQIAHNVTVGEHTILVAQVGIAGSTSIGHHVMIGGQAGLADHIRVGDSVMIAARSGVNRNVESQEVVGGAPVMPYEVFLKSHALLARLPELRQQLRELKERVQEIENKQAGKPKPKKSRRKP
jgi:UDP-3-O-[3-hydroxymyristoyl] glucosamine N-acyltransferase